MSHKASLCLRPLWREAGIGLEAVGLLRHELFREAQGLEGGGRAVLLIPGFLAGDGSLGVMAGWLRRHGFCTKSAGIRFNVGCSGLSIGAVEERLEAHAEKHGRAVVIGQSRGGHFARALAVMRPDLVRGIVTLGTPMLNPFAIHPLVLAQVGVVGLLGTVGVKGLFTNGCRDGDCCRAFWGHVESGLPDGVGYTAIFSRNDGVVDWRACLDPAAEEHVEVGASHCGMAMHAGTYRAVADALSRFGAATGTVVAPMAEAA